MRNLLNHLCFLLFFLFGFDTDVFAKLLSYRKNDSCFACYYFGIGLRDEPLCPCNLNPNT
jgi:hypothetical protein